MAESRRSSAAMVTLFAGLLGAGFALLIAPRSGKETREKIRGKTEDVRQQASVNMMNIRETLEKNLQDAQDLKKRLSEALARPEELRSNETYDYSDIPRRANQSSVLSTWEEEV